MLVTQSVHMTKFNLIKLSGVVLAVLVFSISNSLAVAPKVLAGYDLLQTQSGTTIDGLQLQGVPIGSYNFGGSLGVQNVGNTDTIIQRLADAVAPGLPGTAPAINIQMTDFQLVTSIPVNLGAGLGFYYLTLQSARGGPLSTGQMTIGFAASTNGTFSSTLDVFFDIRFGALNGPIVNSSDVVMGTTGIPWERTLDDPSDLAINGVNQKLDGIGTTGDFWPQGNFTATAPAGQGQVLHNTEVVPEPGTLALATFGLMGLLGLLKRVRNA